MQKDTEGTTKAPDNDLEHVETKRSKMDIIETAIKKAKQLDGLGSLLREFGERSNEGLPAYCCDSIGDLIVSLSEDICDPLEANWDLLIDKVKNEKGSLSSLTEDKEPQNGSSQSIQELKIAHG